MGWAYGTNAEGREVGYSVEAACDEPGCDTQIDRGLAYVCGGMHDGGEHGCGDYFCESHLFFGIGVRQRGQLCGQCIDSGLPLPWTATLFGDLVRTVLGATASTTAGTTVETAP